MGPVVELLLPIDDWWKLEEELKVANYLIAAGESTADVGASYKKIYAICAQYAIRESERKWLYDKSR